MLRNDRINMIIALLIAIGLWVYVVGVENPEKDIQIRDVPITFINEHTLGEKGLTVLSVSDSYVDVQVKGVRSDLKNVDKGDIKIVADLEGYKEGEHIIRLQIGKISNVEVETKQKISIVVDQLVTEEKPISVSLDGSISDDIEPYIVQVSQPTVNITGARTLIDSIVRVDAPLAIDKVGEELKSFTLNLYPVNQDGGRVEKVKMSADTISVSAVNLGKKTIRLDVPIVGVESLDLERTIALPKTITVKGLSADLRDVDMITAETLDVSQVYNDTAIPIIPILPDGVEVASNSQKLQAQITVRGMESRTFEYSIDAVIAEGIDENMTVTMDDAAIRLQVTGRDSIVEALNGNEFTFVVNVRNLKPGSHKAILNCRYDIPLSLVEFEPEVITVHIAEKDGVQEPENENNPADPDTDTEDGSTVNTETEAEQNPEVDSAP